MVINGSTMEWLLHMLKLDKFPAAKAASIEKAQIELDEQMSNYLNTITNNPFFNMVKLNSLQNFITKENSETALPVKSKIEFEEVDVAFIRRLLEIERSDYWKQFEDGYIGRQAASTLSRSVEQALDNTPLIAPRHSLDESFKVPTAPKFLQKLPLMEHSMQNWLFSHLSLSYDIARGFVKAQEEMRLHITSLQPDKESGEHIEKMIDENCTKAFAFIHHINNQYPDIIENLQAKSAYRLLINHKRSLIWKMKHDGILEDAEAQHLIDNIEAQMLKMRESDTRL
jgi:hypothetical protein